TVPVDLPASTATTTVRLFSDPGANPDSLLWTMAMLRVPVDAAAAPAGNDCPPPPPPPPTVGPPPPSDPPPSLSSLRVKPKAFVAGAKKPATISYSSSEAAKVTFKVERVSKGARVGGACVKRTPANAKRKACPRFVPLAGSFSQAAKAGPNSLSFKGRLGKKALASGPYRLVAVALDPAGQSSPAVRTRFQIKPAP
ncbi:MAG TPA: hypothetical protein VGV34_03880, partial [Solirubrobacterales bacterium]|nr:hypothetical protein [Solirubrobacterales bacterium]